MTFNELHNKVVDWAQARNIFDDPHSNPKRQWAKLDEEHHELAKALIADDQDEIEDAIGDMMVVLTMIAHMRKTNLLACYELAYESIKNRRGKMVNGVFVKEE